jgi:homoserine O-acetyltransferase
VGLSSALSVLFIMSSSPLQLQKQAPTREQADALFEQWKAARLKTTDTNDMLYYFDASRNYNPAPKLEAIKVPLTAINSADDLINPPELAIAEREIKRVKNGKLIVLPITEQTRGHGTHSFPAIWQEHLAELLKRSEGK